jgi:hypothetical protein
MRFYTLVDYTIMKIYITVQFFLELHNIVFNFFKKLAYICPELHLQFPQP